MTSSNHPNDRALQQDARAWAEFTDIKYTAALRQMNSPVARGFLGERVSARHLIATLGNHHAISADEDDISISADGIYSEVPFDFTGDNDYIQLALVADLLRMFTPLGDQATSGVGSHELKETVEMFLNFRFGLSYLSNGLSEGRLILAAAAIGLPISEMDYDDTEVDPIEWDGKRPHLRIGISEPEHFYVHRMLSKELDRPSAHHHRPPGYKHLHEALLTCQEEKTVADRWVRPAPSNDAPPFHDWLVLQAGRDDEVGDFATEYCGYLLDSEHRIAHTPDELIRIVDENNYADEFQGGAEEAAAEWRERS